jgi:hypothetical protein
VTQALLVIADIGGYTRFMKVHRINLAHAQHIVARLLEAVIDGAGRTFYVELETLAGPHTVSATRSFPTKFFGWLRMTYRSIPYYLGVKKACDGFRNMDLVLEPGKTRPSAMVPPNCR